MAETPTYPLPSDHGHNFFDGSILDDPRNGDGERSECQNYGTLPSRKKDYVGNYSIIIEHSCLSAL